MEDNEIRAAGTWLPRGAHLFDVIGPAGVKGDAFVGEDDVERVARGDTARFVATIAEKRTLRCRVTDVDRVNVATLDEPVLASVYHGPIPSGRQPGPDKDKDRIVPLAATYRVRIGDCGPDAALGREIAGTVVLGHARASLASRAVKWVMAVVQRESGA